MQILGIAVLSALYYNKRYVILISRYSVLSSTNEFRKHYKLLNHQYFWQTMFSEINFSFKYSGFNKIGRFKYTLKQKLHTNSWMKYELLKKTNLQRIIQICNMDNSFSVSTILSFWSVCLVTYFCLRFDVRISFYLFFLNQFKYLCLNLFILLFFY